MAVRIQLRRDTAANWSQNNPSLRPGEVGIESDTLKIKVGPLNPGNGVATPWNSIAAYANVVPADLNTTLNGYLEVGDLSNTVAEIVDGAVYVPGTDIIFEGTANSHELTLTAPDVTSDKTITLPDATTTLVGTDVSQTLTNKTLTSPVVSGLTLSDSSIVFEGAVADSYETTLTVGEPTADRTITLPDVTGTVVTTGDTASITNAMLAGSIANNKLANSSVTINGYEIALGTSASYGTDNINEGTTNKYFTDERAQDAVAAALAAGTHTNISVSYNDNSNAISLTGAQTYSNEDAVDAVAAALAAGTHTNISVSYDDNGNAISLTGAVTYTDENAQDAVGNSVGNGLDYDDASGAISVDPSEFALSAVGAPIADVSMASYKITNLATPTASGDAATKAYVDNTTAGLNFHAAVHAATTANLDATYANGTGGVGATLTANNNGALVVDGHTLSADERVLVKNQTTGLQNGIYVVTATGDGSNPFILTRATDADNSPAGEVAYGDFCFVQNGSTNAGFGYIVNTTGTITIGTTAISYVQFNAGQVVVAGNGLTESTPGTLAIDTAVTVDLNTAQTLTNKTITGTFTGNLTGNADTVTNGVYTNAANIITAASASTRPLTIKGAASQSTDLVQFQNSSSTPLVAFNLSSDTGPTMYLRNTGSGAGTRIQAWLSDAGATVGYVGNTGVFVIGGVDASTIVSPYGYSTIGTVYNRYGSATISVGSPAATNQGIIVRGHASQSVNLQEWQDSSGTVLSRIASSGQLSAPSIVSNFFQITSSGVFSTGTASAAANTQAYILSRSATNSGLIIQGAASQSANLQEWQNSSGTVLARVGNTGVVVGSAISSDGSAAAGSGYASYLASGNASRIALVVKGFTSQSANLQEWQNSSGTVLTSISSSGAISAPSITLTNALATTSGGTGLTSYTTGDILYASATNTLSKLAAGTDGYLLTLSSGVPTWAAAPISLPSQTGNSGKYLTTDGSTASWATLVVPIETGTATLTANTATTISTTALSAFTSIEYMVSLKQGSKVRTSKVVLQTDGTSVDMTEFAITETGGTMTGVVVSATTSGSDAVLQATVTDASSTNVDVKFSKVKL